MISSQKKSIAFATVNILIMAVLSLFHSTNIIPIAIKGAVPFVPLAFLTALCMFTQETSAVLAGLLVGTLTDSFSATSICFNSIILMIVSLFTALIVHYFFNNNIRSAIALCIICSLFYFAVRWFFTYAFSVSQAESLIYIFKYAIPSAIYTTVFIIPFYYLERFIYNKSKI